MNLRDHKSVKERRSALEKQLGVDLTNIGSFSLDEVVASTRNCENMIGVAQVPMGIAGPLKIISNHESRITNHEYYIPLATTEGALVASVSRGCKAISQSGGAVVDSYRVGATRGAVFHVSGLAENDKLNTFLEAHLTELQNIAAKTSGHLTLTKIFSRGLGRYRYARFVFDTQDAMGMNMATIATTALCQYIEVKTGVRCISVAGNYDVDKKPSWLNIIEGRGIKAWAEVTLPAKVLQDVLKTTAQAVYDVWLAKCMIGSTMAGSMGSNVHFANVIAALFLATGQDVGHVGECSVGMTTMEIIPPASFRPTSRNPAQDKDCIPGQARLAIAPAKRARDDDKSEGSLYVCVYLPDLMVGTVGGGTGLGTQKEALTILGVAGGDEGKNAQKFAEIVAAAVLAGEISLLASLSEGSLARAHQHLARGNTKHEIRNSKQYQNSK
ncbi:hydroxymethylglutaryl-CoA reductase [Candidatus Gottesmanbacteria bacterium]|nr:hydroxymethylglutaryl-CoA reductase [Candidatus Gottesmanbacteria bacterium]